MARAASAVLSCPLTLKMRKAGGPTLALVHVSAEQEGICVIGCTPNGVTITRCLFRNLNSRSQRTRVVGFSAGLRRRARCGAQHHSPGRQLGRRRRHAARPHPPAAVRVRCVKHDCTSLCTFCAADASWRTENSSLRKMRKCERGVPRRVARPWEASVTPGNTSLPAVTCKYRRLLTWDELCMQAGGSAGSQLYDCHAAGTQSWLTGTISTASPLSCLK